MNNNDISLHGLKEGFPWWCGDLQTENHQVPWKIQLWATPCPLKWGSLGMWPKNPIVTLDLKVILRYFQNYLVRRINNVKMKQSYHVERALKFQSFKTRKDTFPHWLQPKWYLFKRILYWDFTHTYACFFL